MAETLDDYVNAEAKHAPRTVDCGCGSCGTCMCHDGCADEQFPLQPGDCEECGACSACIAACAEARAEERPTEGTGG